MAINPPVPKDTRSRLADWLEVEALVRKRGVAARGDVLRLYDFMSDDGHDLETDEVTGEILESEILENDRSECADEVLAEIEHRAKVLGADYPFQLSFERFQWSIRPASQVDDNRMMAARACYLFCLLTSAIRDDRIGGAAIASLRRSMERYFQAVATDAAAGIIYGEAISFGSPRPGGTGFHPALKDASARMRLGRPLQRVPLWSSGKEKDAGIDVIAWQDWRDGRPSKVVMLGQVASGNNWTDKSVKNDTHRFFEWFSERPTEHFIPSIFIPFPLHHNCEPREGASFEEVAFATASHLERGFGLVVDRLRIVEAAATRLATVDSGIETSTLTLLNGWMDDALTLAGESP